MNEKLKQPYNPQETESKIYQKWEESGYFNPDNLPARHKQPYSIIMPPPNANGQLHCGHALDMILKDIIIRFQRMRGKKTLFLPGADHAGFETQMVFEKKLAKEGKSRFQIPQDELYDEIYKFTMENKGWMEEEIKKLGTSCDWSRNTFTLDPEITQRASKTFVKMYQEGLIYRGNRIINWNPKFQTSLSDIETEFIDQVDPFYYLKYGPFTIGTVRPETKFGDKYVVMHPDDERYREYQHGQKIELEWINGPTTATIIKDNSIDMEFGTGVMTITPWHDPLDFEIAERHDLDKEQIIDWRGRLTEIAGEFAGEKIAEARPKIVEKLKAKGLLVRVDENYNHAIRVCGRTNVKIEPQIKRQWFVKMKPLAEKVIQAVEKEDRIKFLPEHQKKVLLHWMHNTLDWNISRQIVWGIPIPAWFRGEEIQVGLTPPAGEGWEKDPDTFDTWFSSGQWPLLTMGFPEKSDFKEYYPTDLMETGTDLIFKWITRMIIFGLYLADEIPFKTVYLHGMVNDANNRKMSKSKGNGASPVEMSEKFGTDALRMALVVGNTPGGTLALSESKIKAYKHFANKIWNATRFVLDNTQGIELDNPPTLSEVDKQYLEEFQTLSQEVTVDTENLRFHLGAEKLYQYFWHVLADEIIEKAKPRLSGEDEADKLSCQYSLLKILKTSLIMLHPYMPFITEEIWPRLPKESGDEELMMITSWPF